MTRESSACMQSTKSSATVFDSILDAVEQSLFRALLALICQRALLFIKVNPAVVIGFDKLYQAGLYASAGLWSIDFVLCDRDTVLPLALIVFERETPLYADMKFLDWLRQLCADIALPIIEIPRNSAFLATDLQPLIEPLFTNPERTVIHPPVGNEMSKGSKEQQRKKSAYHPIYNLPIH
jgi:hypothetical protein